MITERNNDFEIIVVGGGHAGCEAALAAARMGRGTLLVTLRKGDIARMPCNPAIGGLAKGQLVREVDALGGEMGLCIDQTGIQFRMLNAAKGPAVWSPRAQADKKAYHERMLKVLEGERNLEIVEGEVVRIILRGGRASGVAVAGGREIAARKVILALGTFPNGLIHIGDESFPGGREGEPASRELVDSLAAGGFERKRLKTGTPARLARGSIDYSKCRIQPGDGAPSPFSFRTARLDVEQMPCWITYTNERTHAVIRENLHRSPLFAGRIKGIGPRYCPSIEDKVVRFADRERHQLFLEPEGRESEEIYVNGLSTSLPRDVQEEMIRTVPGLEEARIVRHGYAIEYDFFPPHQVQATLESKRATGLYFAGQVNGTSGYEEAAAQGLVAGMNAALSLAGKPPLVLGRHEAYIGVLVDDLITKDIDEPYRMFTSRAEHRLLLRQDNADERLFGHGVRAGLLPREIWERMIESRKRVAAARRQLERESVPAESCADLLSQAGESAGSGSMKGLQLLQRPRITLERIEKALPAGGLGLTPGESRALEISVKYEGYVKRQRKLVERVLGMERTPIPEDFPYKAMDSLSAEARLKLARFRPATLGQASRIAGVRASDLSILMVALKKAAGPLDMKKRRPSRRRAAGRKGEGGTVDCE